MPALPNISEAAPPGLPAIPDGIWRLRAGVARALLFLVAARLLVRFVQLSRWQATLGIPTDAATPAPPGHGDPAERASAFALARRVDRAAVRLPGTSRCLPRAVALHWLLARAHIDSRLVIAVHLRDRTGEHAFHAWTEYDGEIVIGQCERADYRPIMAFAQGSLTAGARGANAS